MNNTEIKLEIIEVLRKLREEFECSKTELLTRGDMFEIFDQLIAKLDRSDNEFKYTIKPMHGR